MKKLSVHRLTRTEGTGMHSFDIAPSGVLNNLPTMSSREICELVEVRHDSVKRTIERLVERGTITRPPLVDGPSLDSLGRPRTEQVYRVGKRDSYVIVAQLSPEFTARLVDRWEQLEREKTSAPAIDLDNPSTLKALLISNLDKVMALEGQVEEMRPQVQALDRIANSEGSLCVTDAAKTLQVQPKALFQFLRSHRWIYSRVGMSGDVAYQDKLASGLLEHKTTTVNRSDGSEKTVTQVRVTAKGLTRLAREFPPVAKVA